MRQLWIDPDGPDDESEIRYSLTALGEAQLETADSCGGPHFRGFEPCVAVRQGGPEPSPPALI
jgi:hypothetical protein